MHEGQPMIISFGWTAQYLPPNGTKDTTRRIWQPRTLFSWQRAWDDGRLTHDAVDKNLAYGGKRIGPITLIERPKLEQLGLMPESDLIREGGMCDTVAEFITRYFEGNSTQDVAVIRFTFQPLEDTP